MNNGILDENDIDHQMLDKLAAHIPTANQGTTLIQHPDGSVTFLPPHKSTSTKHDGSLARIIVDQQRTMEQVWKEVSDTGYPYDLKEEVKKALNDKEERRPSFTYTETTPKVEEEAFSNLLKEHEVMHQEVQNNLRNAVVKGYLAEQDQIINHRKRLSGIDAEWANRRVADKKKKVRNRKAAKQASKARRK